MDYENGQHPKIDEEKYTWSVSRVKQAPGKITKKHFCIKFKTQTGVKWQMLNWNNLKSIYSNVQVTKVICSSVRLQTQHGNSSPDAQSVLSTHAPCELTWQTEFRVLLKFLTHLTTSGPSTDLICVWENLYLYLDFLCVLIWFRSIWQSHPKKEAIAYGKV